MSADIWMPLYIGDYLAATRRLTTEQHGAYLLLIMDYWKQGPPPDDDTTLARIVVTTVENWKRIRPAIEPFFKLDDGRWMHARIDRELSRARSNHSTFHKRAKSAAAARWKDKDATSNATSNATSIRQAMLEQCPPPSPSPSRGGNGKPPSFELIRMEKELARVESRLKEVRMSGTETATGKSFTPDQRTELKSLKVRREELKRGLGFIA